MLVTEIQIRVHITAQNTRKVYTESVNLIDETIYENLQISDNSYY